MPEIGGKLFGGFGCGLGGCVAISCGDGTLENKM